MTGDIYAGLRIFDDGMSSVAGVRDKPIGNKRVGAKQRRFVSFKSCDLDKYYTLTIILWVAFKICIFTYSSHKRGA